MDIRARRSFWLLPVFGTHVRMQGNVHFGTKSRAQIQSANICSQKKLGKGFYLIV